MVTLLLPIENSIFIYLFLIYFILFFLFVYLSLKFLFIHTEIIFYYLEVDMENERTDLKL